MDLNRLTLKEAIEGVKKRKFSSPEIIDGCQKAIFDLNHKIHAFLSVAKPSSLIPSGLPLAVKDNILTASLTTTASSRVLKDFKPPYDASLVKKLLTAGAFIIGKTNLDAWGHGSSTETSDFGPTLNPWDFSKLAGGSSGGSAAAVAADLCLAALGTETAGSIRGPASWCGVVGFKPSYGRVSRYGIVAMASSFDCPGPITKSVWDAAFLLSLIAGNDPLDATTLREPVPNYTQKLTDSIKGIKVGLPREYFAEGVDRRVAETVEEAVKELEKLGCHIKKISLLKAKYAISVYTILQRAEVSSNLARYDGLRFGNPRDFFAEEAKRRIMLGTYTLSAGYYEAYYQKAEKARTLIVQDFQKAFAEVDLIVGPVLPTTALPVGSSLGKDMFGEMADVLVEPSSIAGLPGISLPCGLVEGLPVGINIVGPSLSEELILRVAHHYERETPWHRAKPQGWEKLSSKR